MEKKVFTNDYALMSTHILHNSQAGMQDVLEMSLKKAGICLKDGLCVHCLDNWLDIMQSMWQCDWQVILAW